MRFTIGDKVRGVNRSIGCGCDGHEYLIITDTSGNCYKYDGYDLNGQRFNCCSNCFKDNNLEYYKTNKKINMNLKETFSHIFLKEPEKSFRKAGVTDSDGTLTTEGQSIFLSWLLKENGDAFKTEVIDPVLLETKEDK